MQEPRQWMFYQCQEDHKRVNEEAMVCISTCYLYPNLIIHLHSLKSKLFVIHGLLVPAKQCRSLTLVDCIKHETLYMNSRSEIKAYYFSTHGLDSSKTWSLAVRLVLDRAWKKLFIVKGGGGGSGNRSCRFGWRKVRNRRVARVLSGADQGKVQLKSHGCSR